jgi:hypothetical protein
VVCLIDVKDPVLPVEKLSFSPHNIGFLAPSMHTAPGCINTFRCYNLLFLNTYCSNATKRIGRACFVVVLLQVTLK